jgi:hypothetical protein
MAAIYDRKWSKRFEKPDGTSNTAAVKIWAVQLVKKGVTPKALQRCLEKTIDEYPNFAPTLPEVIQMCQPSEKDFDVPDFETAFWEATVGRGRFGPGTDGHWKWAAQTHLAVYHAVKNIKDVYNFGRLATEPAKKVFAQAWQKVLNDLSQGKQLEPPPPVIEYRRPEGPTIPEREKSILKMKKTAQQTESPKLRETILRIAERLSQRLENDKLSG